MMAKLSPSGRIILWFLLVSTVLTLIDALDHNCQQDLDTITGETEGKIITRRQNQIYYGNNYDCKWLIDAGEGKKVKLTVLSTNLEWAPTYTTCSQYDNLKIIEGNSERGDVITAICGDRNPYHVISQGRYLFLTFQTTHQNFENWKGVELLFEVFDNSTCPPGWFASGEDWCISVNQGKAQWLDSQTICSYSRANLASITSGEEYQLIYDNGVNIINEAWIGLHDKITEGTFAWIDREKFIFQRSILPSKPNYDEYDCVAQSFTGDLLIGEWAVEKCDTELNYICKARKDGTTKIYNAVQSSDSPEAGGKEEKVNFIVIIVVCIIVVLLGIGLVFFIIKKRQNPDMCSRKPKNTQKQELSTTRYRSQGRTGENVELDEGGFSQRDRTARPSAPPAPTGEATMMVADPQQIAPPTYEESRFDPIAPANF